LRIRSRVHGGFCGVLTSRFTRCPASTT
jgi:hypothetical protein